MDSNNDVERMWKEAFGPNLRYSPSIYLEGLRKNKNRLSLSQDLYPEPLNKKQQCYTLSCEILLLQFTKQKIK
jgi:hypothetical protein